MLLILPIGWRQGPSAGVFEGDKLVAWALTQDDGAISCLQALEDYRGKGYALAVTRSVVDRRVQWFELV